MDINWHLCRDTRPVYYPSLHTENDQTCNQCKVHGLRYTFNFCFIDKSINYKYFNNKSSFLNLFLNLDCKKYYTNRVNVPGIFSSISYMTHNIEYLLHLLDYFELTTLSLKFIQILLVLSTRSYLKYVEMLHVLSRTNKKTPYEIL